MFKRVTALALLMLLTVPALAETLVTQHYTVDLPDTWKAVMPPTENQGTTSAIFANGPGNATVTLLVGPTGGADAKTIAQMFSSQFKAPKPPVEKTGQYVFTFTQQGLPCQSWVATQGDTFMLTTLAGDRKEGQAFLKKYVKSPSLPNLLPK